MASPTFSPTLSTSPSMLSTVTGPRPVPVRRTSISSIRSLSSDSGINLHRMERRSSSSFSIPLVEGNVEVITEEGVRHAESRLQARRYKTPPFAQALLELLLILRIPSWSSFAPGKLSSQLLRIHKVSGSLTNAVFFVSYPAIPSVKTVLLRIYGSSSSSLISRPRELHTLHILSSEYHIGPRVYGTFENGRVEEYFDSIALSASDLRDPKISGWIGARMAELHCVDIDAIEQTTPSTRGENIGWEIAARKNVRSWRHPARSVLQLRSVTYQVKEELNIDKFMEKWEKYMEWLSDWERAHGASKRVFAHNDTQYGNLLKLSKKSEGVPEHRQIIVVDFEYASPNSAAFDIANHFHEWTADYHGLTPHILDPSRYPTENERRNFYRAYLTHACPPFTTVPAGTTSNSVPSDSGPSLAACEMLMDIEDEMKTLEEQVKVWSPASHAMWAIWGIVQAREDMEALQTKDTSADEPEFDYLGYARCRMAGFRREVEALGL